MTATPQGIDQDILGEKISAMLERNGTLTDKEWRQLMTYFVQDMRADIKALMSLPTEIHNLKKKNIWIWVENHPKISIPVIGLFVGLIVIHITEIWPVVERAAIAISKIII
jgi:hypothetical protein